MYSHKAVRTGQLDAERAQLVAALADLRAGKRPAGGEDDNADSGSAAEIVPAAANATAGDNLQGPQVPAGSAGIAGPGAGIAGSARPATAGSGIEGSAAAAEGLDERPSTARALASKMGVDVQFIRDVFLVPVATPRPGPPVEAWGANDGGGGGEAGSSAAAAPPPPPPPPAPAAAEAAVDLGGDGSSMRNG